MCVINFFAWYAPNAIKLAVPGHALAAAMTARVLVNLVFWSVW
jgi:hypothetical protein